MSVDDRHQDEAPSVAVRSERRYALVLNARAGSAAHSSADAIAKLAADHDIELTIDDRAELPLGDRLARAAEGEADVVIAAGGDGTVTATAVALQNTQKVLGVLPLGTANLLARDLKLPLTVPEWMAALPSFEPRRIDAGEVNGRLFLHKVVLGSILKTAEAREAIRDRTDLGAGIEYITNFWQRLAETHRFAVEIAPRGAPRRVEMVEALAVANNDYDEGLGRFFSRERLDRGTLSLYIMRRLRPLHALRLAAEMLIGRWRSDTAIEIENLEAVTIRSRRKTVHAMVDGEIGTLTTPLQFRVLPASVTVLAPPVPQLVPET